MEAEAGARGRGQGPYLHQSTGNVGVSCRLPNPEFFLSTTLRPEPPLSFACLSRIGPGERHLFSSSVYPIVARFARVEAAEQSQGRMPAESCKGFNGNDGATMLQDAASEAEYIDVESPGDGGRARAFRRFDA